MPATKSQKPKYRITLPGFQYDIAPAPEQDWKSYSPQQAWSDYCQLTGCKTKHTPKISLLADDSEKPAVTTPKDGD